ncbi:MAG: hypothetical protein LBN08_00640 [Lactobacillales bacterium]|jgi:hypothetical protein|nr:hypothetical protein [Lactobacillales bacterium]
MLEPKVVFSRCSKTKDLFGVRIDPLNENEYVGTWAFKLPEAALELEGYEDTTKSLKLSYFTNDYPGCPHCERPGVFFCSCGKLNCHIDNESITCAWCGTRTDASELVRGEIDVAGGAM